MWVVGIAKGNPIIVNTRVNKNAAITFILPEVDEILGLEDGQYTVDYRLGDCGTDLDIIGTDLNVKDGG